jgi:hypothetical protein
MPLNLSLTRGPLAEEALDAIVATYGTVDPRYASRDFCRVLFNENPIGYSYHAFVRDGDRVVGHYSVIPMRVRARGATVVSGKGEALFLAPPYRATAIVTPAGDVLAGIAMIKSLDERALADGITVIHGITTPAVGIILRMNGSRALKLSLDQLHFLIRAPESPRVLSRAQIERLLCACQRVLLAAARAALRLTAAPSIEANSSAHADQHLATLAATDADGGVTWTISRDLETLRWMKRVGRLEVVSIVGRPEHFAVMTKGDSRELLLWRVPAGARRSGLAIVCGLLMGSVRDQARIVLVTRRLAAQGGPSLRFALRMLGFFPKRIPTSIYAKSADDFFLKSANLDFSRLFNL